MVFQKQYVRYTYFFLFTFCLILAGFPRIMPSESRVARAKPNEIGDYPIIPTIDATLKSRLQIILTDGQAQGNHLDTFAKIGDSITQEGYFLWGVGCSTETLGDHGDLASTISTFRSRTFPAEYTSPYSFCPPTSNAFNRNSAASIYGGASNRLLEPWPDTTEHPECITGEIALQCELRVMQPSIALIMIGTNDLYYYNDLPIFRANLTRIITETMAAGTIPVVSTIPPRLDSADGVPLGTRVEPYNQVIVEVAEAQQIPLWNYWRTLQDPNLVNQGLNSDDHVHPNVYPSPNVGLDGADLSAEGLRYGYNQRTLNAIQILAKLKEIVIEDGAADGASPTPNPTQTPIPTPVIALQKATYLPMIY